MPFATRVATRGFDSRRLHQTCYARDMRAVLLLCLAVAMCAASCRVAGQNDHNLSQLHDSDTRHRYRGVLVSDFEYVARTALGKSLENADLSLAQANEGKIANPTEECVDNLADLLSLDGNDATVFALQLEWCARLAVEDPAIVVRELAMEGLGPLGAQLQPGLPQAAGAGSDLATPEMLSAVFAQMLNAVRAAREGAADATQRRTDAVTALRALRMDAAGLWRAARLVREVRRVDPTEGEDLRALTRDLQVQLWKRAVGAGLTDRDERVRAAAMRTCTAADPQAANAVVWELLRREDSDYVRIAMARMLQERGLPQESNGVTREMWLEHLYGQATGTAEEAVRVAAMMALSAQAQAGFQSLREEDWQAWWLARK